MGVWLLLAVAARAEDWPQFRGPNRDGAWHDTGLAATFPPGGPRVRWREAVGWGCSSPVVAGGRVMVSDADLADGSARERVHCFEESTGKTLWTFRYEVAYPQWAFVAGQHGGPCATPVVEDGRVYVIGANGHVHCLDATDGSVRWQKDLRDDYVTLDWACRASPLIEGDLLILFAGAKPGGCVMALDRQTGREVWKALDEPVSNSSPLVIEAGGRRQLILWTGVSVSSLDPATGTTRWREAMVTSNNDAIPTPVAGSSRLLIGGLMMSLTADKPAPSILWPASRAVSKRILSNTSTAILQGDHVYSARSGGTLVCLEASSGDLVWETNTVTELQSGASIHITPIGARSLLFTDRGDLVMATLSPDGYREIDRAHVIEPTSPIGSKTFAWVAPAYANGCGFVRNDKEIVCLDLRERP